jgi:hypothetical protein
MPASCGDLQDAEKPSQGSKSFRLQDHLPDGPPCDALKHLVGEASLR